MNDILLRVLNSIQKKAVFSLNDLYYFSKKKDKIKDDYLL